MSTFLDQPHPKLSGGPQWPIFGIPRPYVRQYVCLQGPAMHGMTE